MGKTLALGIGEVCSTATPLFPRRLSTYRGSLGEEEVFTSHSGKGNNYVFVLYVSSSSDIWQLGGFSVVDTREATFDIMKRTKFDATVLPDISRGTA